LNNGQFKVLLADYHTFQQSSTRA